MRLDVFSFICFEWSSLFMPFFGKYFVVIIAGTILKSDEMVSPGMYDLKNRKTEDLFLDSEKSESNLGKADFHENHGSMK